MIELRFLVRGSSRVLQYRERKMAESFGGIIGGWSDWQDVPQVPSDEEGK
jgi:hypothetical protein